ncbi:MAG: NAD(P)-dependent oxidoreductase [Bacteroidaceae bacterium]|nr:NAD(P)-dependent oxidoreductase [Bacteroidaceae bacterium]
MNKVLRDDINDFVKSFGLAKDLKDSTFLITGGTGLIGSVLIRCLLALDKKIRIIAPVRNKLKAKTLYGEDASKVEFIECDLLTFDYDTVGDVDYIVHCAAPTASRFFVNHAVETFDAIVQGTSMLLQYASKVSVKSFVYLSSLEVYGRIDDESQYVTEDVQGYLDPMAVRSSYPMAKRAAETLCHLYAKEFHVPVKIARLTQTTGAGIARDDNRVIAQFARLTAEGKDIVLHTTGESARPYCYTMDAISAILYILLRGADGEAYNVANEETYISAMGMAHFLREEFCPQLDVRVELNDNMGYAPPTKLRLSTDKLQALGWRPQYGLRRIFNQLIEYLKSS